MNKRIMAVLAVLGTLVLLAPRLMANGPFCGLQSETWTLTGQTSWTDVNHITLCAVINCTMFQQPCPCRCPTPTSFGAGQQEWHISNEAEWTLDHSAGLTVNPSARVKGVNIDAVVQVGGKWSKSGRGGTQYDLSIDCSTVRAGCGSKTYASATVQEKTWYYTVHTHWGGALCTDHDHTTQNEPYTDRQMLFTTNVLPCSNITYVPCP